VKTGHSIRDNATRDITETLARTVNALIDGDVKDTAWHEVGAADEPEFQNSWHNYGYPYATLAYRKDSTGYVHLKGRVIGGAVDTVVFTLPLGYRPESTLVLASPMGATGWIEVGASGDVKIITA
jgi:hypothetical protein